jgi:eukaryotic-like serine/threonine-protein kinase
MALAPGTRLGPYEITGPLGAGGMGEVYRARDPRLGRDVAIKVLPAQSAASPELRARLEREARAIAALKHAHICTLYDIGHSGETDYLVMELVDGETLAARLARGPLPLAEVLRIGSQIAEALQRAHRAGIVHRDLKPGNVMLAKDGAKLMDFGLARGSRALAPGMGQSHAPTESAPITDEGRIVGTFQYMAPEQLEGREPDVRSDIWSLGATLYEMATGRLAFEGQSAASLISAIMKDEPRPLAELVPMSPPALDRLIRTCLAKDPDARWQSAGDLARELEWIRSAPSAGAQGSGALRGARVPMSGSPWLWAAATAAIVLALVSGKLAGWMPSRVASDGAVTKTEVTLPSASTSALWRNDVALSPDGTMLAVAIADSSGTTRLYIRRLNELEVRPLPGSEGAVNPFWAPNSKNVAFLTDEGRLVRLGLGGGIPQTICKAENFAGGAWGTSGWIVFGNRIGPIMRVPDRGGLPEAVTTLDSAYHERGHAFPDFLPDGRHFTFVVDPPRSSSSFDVRVGSVDRARERHLMFAHHAPRGDGRGWLVFARDRALFAQRVDREGRNLIGAPIPMIEAPELRGGASDPLVSLAPAVLAYQAADRRLINLYWCDRNGVPGKFISRLNYQSIAPEISPSVRQAITRRIQGGETWLVSVNLESGAQQRLTSPEEWNSWPIWARESDRVLYAASPGAAGGFEIREVDPRDPGTFRVILADSMVVGPAAVSRGDKDLFLVRVGPGGDDDICITSMEPGGTPRLYAATAANEYSPAILPDGKSVAFVSDVTGRPEIYLDEFPDRRRATQITGEGCSQPIGLRHLVWSVGSELIYCARDGRTIHSIRLERSGGRWVAREDRALFVLPYDCYGFCPAPDGSRFLVMVAEGFPKAPSVTLVQNWQAELPH